MSERLAGKVALVFGAGSSGPGWGNGKATAYRYVEEGATVIGVDIDSGSAEETGDVIADSSSCRNSGGTYRALAADATNSESVKTVVDNILATERRIDILHNNVGFVEMGGPEELSEESWGRVFDLNVKTVFLACKHVLPLMRKQKAGAIINISSLASIRFTGYEYIAYYASKAAVNHFTVGLALQHAKEGIRVNAIMPGLMNTPLIRKQIVSAYEGDQERMIAERDAISPTGKMGDAWDIANTSVFLASEEAQYINGHCLPVDGGLNMKVM